MFAAEAPGSGGDIEHVTRIHDERPGAAVRRVQREAGNAGPA